MVAALAGDHDATIAQSPGQRPHGWAKEVPKRATRDALTALDSTPESAAQTTSQFP
jgi:hypothetical protein